MEEVRWEAVRPGHHCMRAVPGRAAPVSFRPPTRPILVKGRRRATAAAPVLLRVPRFQQPDDLTCGPTCLAQVYRYYGLDKKLEDVIAEAPRNPDGGTMAVYLGLDALRNGLRPTLYCYDLKVFDPTWWKLPTSALIEKLTQRRAVVGSKRLARAATAYITYLEQGGRIQFGDLDKQVLVRILLSSKPVLTGLSATYLYRSPREYADRSDDVRGDPVGHFVVICGYYAKTDRFVVCDPSIHIPFSRSGRYSVAADRLIAAILLGDVTYDAVLLVLAKH